MDHPGRWLILQVEDELWETTELLRQRKQRLMKKKGGDRTAFSTYLLTGLITCAECEGNFIANKQVGKNPDKAYIYYHSNYHSRRGNSVCANKIGLRGDQLEGAVLSLLQRDILTKKNVQMLVEEVQKVWDSHQQDNPDKDLKRVDRDIKKLNANLPI